MAHSLEARSPFLDHELMELAATLPPDLKLSGGRHKLVLRAALRDWLPDEILDRPKMGFGVPISEWLRGELRGFLHDVLLDPVSLDRGLFRKTSVERLIEGHQTGEEHGGRLWALLMLELWFRELADRPASTEEKLGEAETSRLRS